MNKASDSSLITIAINIFASLYLYSIVDMRLSDTLDYFSAKQWPTTQGIIARAGHVPAESHFLFLTKTGIQPKIQFRYRVRQRDYLGTTPWLGANTVIYSTYEHGRYTTSFKDQLLADYISRNLQAGDTVTVYYNPDAPEEAVIEHLDAMNGFWSYWMFMGLAVFFMTNAIRLLLSG